MIAACDLADDLRDAIVEYQVSADVEQRMQGGSLMTQFTVRAAGGNLRAELQIDCKSKGPRFERKNRTMINLCRI